jgi:hypothetical protein
MKHLRHAARLGIAFASTLVALTSILIGLTLLTATASAQSNPQPLLYQSISPLSTPPGGPAFTLTVNGTGFVPGAVVQWNGSPRSTTFISGSSVQAAITAGDIAKASTSYITVLNPGPGGGTSNSVFFCVTTPESFLSVAQDDSITTPGAFIVGDFRGLGTTDVISEIGSTNGPEIAFYQDKGNGTFRTPVYSNAGGVEGSTFFTGDFNNDGKPDLILNGYVGFSPGSEVYLNNGNGTFALGPTPEGGNPIALGDFNGDGNLDAIGAACSLGSCNLLFMPGNGKGRLSRGPYIDPNDSFDGSIVVGDFNGDGILDFISGGAYLFLGEGNGHFKNPISIPINDGGDMAAADFNGDGKLDFVVDTQDGLCVALGNGDGTFNINCLGNYQDSQVFLGDFNGDNKLDIALTFNSQVIILPGNGDGTFGSPLYAGQNTAAAAIGDFNNDGRLDFAAYNNSGIALYLQTGVSLSPPSLNFGSLEAGKTSPPQVVTVTNNGDIVIPIVSVAIAGNDPTDFTAKSHCGSAIQPGASCSIDVFFTPNESAEGINTLNVTYGGAVSTIQQVDLSGITLTTTAVFSPKSLNFGDQIIGTTSAPQTLNLANVGPETLTITGTTLTGPYTYTTNCGSTLAPHSQCQYFISFAPTSIYGYGSLSIQSNAQSGPQTAGFSGTGTELLVSPPAINFGDQAVGTTSAPAAITLTNENTSGIKLYSFILGGADSKDFTMNNGCGKNLMGGQSCSISVTFTPGNTGARRAKITVDGGYGGQVIALSGTGT